ncbi:MAG: hypothetical protein K2J20_05960 [Bacilli bacterium]|nr:hypothetical protein [Bacilli bacterium]
MKKIKIAVLTMILFFISTHTVSAVCSAEELNRLNALGVNVHVSYEEARGEMAPGTYSPPEGLSPEEIENYVAYYNYFKIYISNLTEDIYVKVYDDVTEKTRTYTYASSDNGTLSLEWDELRTIVNYTITVYSSNKTGCPDTKLSTLYLTTPRYNDYSEWSICEGIEEYYLCYKYLSVDEVSENEFYNLAAKYKEAKEKKQTEDDEKEKNKDKGFLGFLKTNSIVVIITIIVVIAAGGAITVIIVKKRRSE